MENKPSGDMRELTVEVDDNDIGQGKLARGVKDVRQMTRVEAN